MNPQHLSDDDAQQAAEASALPAGSAAHLLACAQCQARVAAYRQLFGMAARLPRPAFDFDLATSVVAQLPPPQPSFRGVLSGLALLVGAVAAALLAWFGRELLLAFAGLPAGLGVGAVLVAGMVVAVYGWEQLTQYRRQLRLLTFS